MTSFDVIVVGGGGAGLAAAIEARTLGREVLLLEKNERLGGSTAWSIGSVTASATPHQIKKGIKDSPYEHFLDMPGFAGDLEARDNEELRRILCDAMPDTFRWLLELGVRFYGPMPEPPHQQPRMHNVLPNSRAYIYHLERRARRLGVRVRTGCRVRRLLVEDGRVTGALWEEQGEERQGYAAGGVVLAAGDFTNGAELKARYLGAQAAKVEGVNRTATGDGQTMALAVGARILNGDLALGPELRFVPPAAETLVRRLPPWPALAELMAWSLDHLPPWLLRPFVMSFVTTALAPSPTLFEHGAVLVNSCGERFCDELDGPALALPDQPGRIGYLVLDRAAAARFSAWPHFISTAPGVAYAYLPDYRRNRPDIHKEAGTLEELGGRLGMSSGTLEAAVRTYNREVAAEATAAGLNRAPRPRLETPPFTALGPVKSVFVHNEGGLAVNADHQVLDEADRPIAGLYAAGATGQGGLLLKGHGHHLAWAFTSGRRAGRRAAYRATSAGLEPGRPAPG